MSLRARLTFLCLAFLILSVGAAGVGATLALRANDARRERADIAMASQVAVGLESSFVFQAASIRAYFLGGDATSFDEYNTARTRASDQIGRLQGLLFRTPYIALVQAVNDAARTWRSDAIVPLITLQEQQGASAAVIEQYRNGPAVSSFQRIADALRELRARVDAGAKVATTRQDASRRRVAQFAVGAVLAAVVALVAVRLFSRLWISRPLNRLGRALRDDDATTPIPRGGATELVTLSGHIRAIRERAHDETELATRTREGLMQNAAVLMSLRAQLETSPDSLPAGWAVAAQLVPALGIVAGDCYNVDVIGRDVMTIVVVDVAGHGAASAVVALRAKELLRAAVRSYTDPADAVSWSSLQLSDLDPDMFVTAFIARLDFTSGLLRYVNAGHPEALVCDGVNIAELGPTGPLIGPFVGTWATSEAIIGRGQNLVIYTDGLIEVRNESREEFGLERLGASLLDNYGDTPDALVKQCLADVDTFGHGRAHDDITLTVIARAGLS